MSILGNFHAIIYSIAEAGIFRLRIITQTKEAQTMTCRIGITTDLEGRKEDWERWCQEKGYRMTDWRKLKTCKTQQEAQQWEDTLSAEQGCKSKAGGRKKDGLWYVYRVDYQ